VALSGSLVIGLAAAEGMRPPEALWAASRIDEDWQIAQWGEDAEAAAAAGAARPGFPRCRCASSPPAADPCSARAVPAKADCA
jgi:DnaJ-domain-containing protein 1